MTSVVSVPGTFNGWDSSAGGQLAEAVAANQFELRCHLPAGRHAFKWVFDHDPGQYWGCRGTESLVVPTAGVAVPGGDDVELNVLLAGEFRFRIDVRTRRWGVTRVADGPLLAGALEPEALLDGGRFAEAFRALREGGDRAEYGYNWRAWDCLAPFLEQGGYRGFFPVRQGHRVLFVHNARLSGPLYLTGTMNHWTVGSDCFTLVPHSDVHLLYRELEPGSLHAYKLFHEGAWWADPLNRWVQPDGQPIPLFRPGGFNSMLDLGEPLCERDDALLWYKDFPSIVRGNRRDIFISLPADYARSPHRHYPVLYVHDGNEAVTRATMHRAARGTVDEGLAEPCILVFIALASQDQREYEYRDADGRDQYADFICRELVPFVDNEFRTRADAEGRGIVGASFGGVISYYIGWRHSDVFGKIGGQGASLPVDNWEVLRLYEDSPRRRLQLYLDSSAPSNPQAPRDSNVASKYAEKVLRAAGYRVRHLQRRDQKHDWPAWRERFPEVLRTFWPPKK